jgi:hypothetical protein
LHTVEGLEVGLHEDVVLAAPRLERLRGIEHLGIAQLHARFGVMAGCARASTLSATKKRRDSVHIPALYTIRR